MAHAASVFAVIASSIAFIKVDEKRRMHWFGMKGFVATHVEVTSAIVGVGLSPSRCIGTNASSSSKMRGRDGSCVLVLRNCALLVGCFVGAGCVGIAIFRGPLEGVRFLVCS